MIQAFVGLVGGGKSFNSVRRMCSYMAKGGKVCTNILLTGWDSRKNEFAADSPVLPFLESIGWRYQHGQYTYVPFDDMVDDAQWFKRIPAGVDRDHRTLVVVDEATDLFDSLDGSKLKGDIAYRELFRFLRLSRHAHVDVLFICQDLNCINSRLKGLVSGIWRSTDMKGFKLKGIPIPFPFDTFLLQLFDRTGRNLIQRDWVRKDPRIFTLYQSESFGGALGIKWSDTAVGDGTIKKGEDPMSPKERFLFGVPLLASVVMSAVSLFRSPPPPPAPSVQVVEKVVTNNLQSIERPLISSPSLPLLPAPPAPPPPTNTFHYGEYKYHRALGEHWVDFDGKLIKRGLPCVYGTVLDISSECVVCKCDDGTFAYLLPLSASAEARN